MLRLSTFAARAFALPLVLALASLAACSTSSTSSSSGGSSSGSSGSSGGCVAYSSGTLDLKNPTVSFKNDVVAGLFNKSCGLSTSCHGSPTSSQAGLFLGAKDQVGADASKVRTNIVGVMARDLATMPMVTAGDPTKSFLMHKMDGDQCVFNAQCVGGDCNTAMPQGVDILPPDRRDVVRRWIAQGALDN